MSLESIMTVEHTNDTVHPYIRRDVQHAEQVSFDVWIAAVLKLDNSKLKSWIQYIKQHRWHEDSDIQNSLARFATAEKETARYEPLADLSNRILDMARGHLPGVKSYPIQDIKMTRNDPSALNCIPEHGSLGAVRKPDLLLVRGEKLETSDSRVVKFDWTDVLKFSEVKAFQILADAYDELRRDRGLPDVDPHTLRAGGKTGKQKSRRKPSSSESDVGQVAGSSGGTAQLETKSSEGATGLIRGLDYEDHDAADTSKRHSGSSASLVTADGKVQAGGYALEVAACTYGTRLFCLGEVIEDDKVSLWYYDAAGIVRTRETISIIRDFEKYAAIVVAFGCCDPSQFGALPPVIRPPLSSSYPENFPPRNLKGYSLDMTMPKTNEQITLTLQDHIFTQYSLVGRRTFLYAIKTNSKTLKKPLIAKFSYQVTTRRAEQELVEIAHKAGVEHLPEVHLWGDLWNMSDGMREAFHIKNEAHEDRVLRGLVYSKYRPLKELFSESCDLLPDMVDQMIDCLHDLRYKANILHRDISCNNIMYEKRRGKIYFILIDFDFASLLDPNGLPAVRSKDRTGTLPFMAIELIADMANSAKGGYKRITHRLRHDFESLFYVAVWYIVTMPPADSNAKEKTYRTYIRQWEDGDLATIVDKKSGLFNYEDAFERIPIPTQCETLAPWLLRFWGVFRMAFLVKTLFIKRADKETLGGVVCRSAIKQALAGQSKPSDSVWSWERFMSAHPYLTYKAGTSSAVMNSDGHNGRASGLHREDGSDSSDEDVEEPATEVILVKQRRNTRKATTTKTTTVKRTTTKKVSSARKFTEAKATPVKKPMPRRVAKKTATARTMTTRSMVKTKKA
ncbi:hypothetical protein PHLCEN_2v4372 [Hermanssonia centrifuga]|uniref:Protein kinase domain-containing protein n=1 Tax=Hermanssonia centrifuga TaxID=98765 RepID=A0A2R6PV79_9APHY|nr:hypothetical protein PHLCEN_2v4372 [Hermanssonia centrifuga]